MKKIKILLGAYVDSVNAQNINCREIAKRLDKEKFEVHVLVHSAPMNEPGVISHKVEPGFLKKNIKKYLIMKNLYADIYYLPRVEKVDILFARLLGKKRCIVSSVEITTVYDNELYRKFFNKYIADYFCISEFLNKKNEEKWGVKKEVLYLGIPTIHISNSPHEEIRRIAFVGSVEERKRPMEFAKIAKRFPDISFVMIGGGTKLDKIKDFKKRENVSNLELTGRLNNEEVLKKLSDADLLLLLSKAEGLPKVVLEAAAVGAPTIYVDEYYSVDYVVNGENGVAVHKLDDVEKAINILIKDKNKYRNMSENALQVVPIYLWDVLISEYEQYFMRVSRCFANEHKVKV